MRKRLILSAMIFIVETSGSNLRAQQVVPETNAAAPAKVRIYLAAFSGSTGNFAAGATDLKTFLNSYMYLRLGQIANASITGESPDPACGQEPAPLTHAMEQTALRSIEFSSFYTVRGTLETHPREGVEAGQSGVEELVINYEVLKTVRCAPQLLLRRGEAISQAHFLDSLNVIADTVAFRVGEDASKKIRVNVTTVMEDKSGPEETEFAQALTGYLVKALETTDDLLPHNADSGANPDAEYALEARVSFARSANLLRGFARNADISLYVLALSQAKAEISTCSANPHCYTLTATPIHGMTSQRLQIFNTVADVALKGISDVRYAREAGLPKDYSTEDAMNRARQLLCDGAEPNRCTPQVDAAISLLQKAPRNVDTLEWLGRAQYLAGRYADSAQLFSSSINASPAMSLEAALRLNLSAGAAWYMAQNYNNAVNSYDSAAKILVANPGLRAPVDFNVPRALSHRFKGERLEAVDLLLHPLDPVKNPENLQLELEHIVAALTPDELPQAIQSLEKDAVTNKRPLLKAYDGQARAQISAGHLAEAETTIQKALALHDEQSQATFNYLLTSTQFWLLQGTSAAEDKKTGYRQIVDRLEPLVKADPAGQQYGPFSLQMQLCADYLGDRDCVTRTIGYLERANVKELPVSIELDLIEIQVLDRNYAHAVDRLDRICKKKDLEPRLRTVAKFYQVWAALAEDNVGSAERWFKEWQEALKNLRKAGPLDWTFGGAHRNLEEQGGSLSTGSRQLLEGMIAAMEDEKAPAVSFHH